MEKEKKPKKEEGATGRGGYKKRYCEDMIAYFSQKPQTEHFKKTYHADGTLKSEEPVVLPRELPTFQGFADQIGVCRSLFDLWRAKYPAFDEAYGRARQLQEKIVLVNSMSGLYSSQFAQFFCKNCLDGAERETQEEPEEKDFSVEIRVVEP